MYVGLLPLDTTKKVTIRTTLCVLQGSNVKTLAELLQEKPDSRDSILKFVHETLTATISKGTISYSLVHRIIREFFECANDAMKQVSGPVPRAEENGGLSRQIVGAGPRASP